jgi:enediyne biosynthesis protein E3
MPSAEPIKQNLSLLSRLKGRLFGLSPKEASFSRRGFPGRNSSSRAYLESVIHAFIEGYNLALGEGDMFQLARRLDSSFSPAFVGFAYEGAGLYFGLTDLLIPRSESSLAAFTRSAARRHDFIIMVGAGFAIARAPLGLRRLESYQRALDPMTSWCLADGYGFHQGFFHWKRFIEERQAAPESLNPQNRRLFDAGVGRAMWWVFGADPASIASAISRFDSDRQPEMWTGIGTAIAYAGGGPTGASSLLLDLAGTYRFDLLSGIPFAAHMRDRGGNPAECTDEVCSTMLNMSAAETSALIFAELTDYLDSWQGAEQDKWNKCYIALRDRVKRRLDNGCLQSPESFAWAKRDC